MLFGRNLIALNHFSKTGGSSIIQMLAQAHSNRLIVPFQYDSQTGIYDYRKFEILETQVKSDPSNFVYTHFHPGDVGNNEEIVNFLQSHAILMCVLRRPSDVFESLIRYYHQQSQQNPTYFRQMLENKFIIASSNPNFIFDECLKELDQKHTENHCIYHLSGYIQSLLPSIQIRSFSVFSRNLSDFISQDIVHFDSGTILEIAKKDYFAICTIEQLEDLVKFLKSHSILPHDMELPHVNRSQGFDQLDIPLTDDRKDKINLELNSFTFSIWNHLMQYGPLFQDNLINPDVVIF